MYGAAPGQGEEDGHDGSNEEGVADEVDAAEHIADGVFLVVDLEEGDEEEKSGAADGQVEVEDPAPGDALGHEAANDGPKGEDDGEDGEDDAHVFGPLAEWEQITDNDIHQDVDAATAEALDGAAGDESFRAFGGSRDGRANGKQHHGENGQAAPAEDVGCLAVERLEGGHGEHVCVGDPHVGIARVQVLDDGR